jgi:hypothetical protein
VSCLLKARIVKTAKSAVAREQLCNMPVARQWLSNRHMTAATDTHATTEEPLESVFSLRSLSRLNNEKQLLLSGERERESRQTVNREFLVDEVGDISEILRKGNVRRWKPLPSNAVKTVTKNTSLCE